jgi:ssDNA-binding Zn-finger/Zn-ribbon topoisomerase 1
MDSTLIGFLAPYAIWAGLLALFYLVPAVVRKGLQVLKPCPHGIRNGSNVRCGTCAAEIQRAKEQHKAEQLRWAQQQAFERQARLLREKEIERLSEGWLSNTESYLVMQPRQFENAIAELFRTLGYRVEQTPYSNDGGKDAIAEKDGMKVLIECKKYAADRSIGRRDLQIFAAAIQDEKADGGIYVNTGSFTSTAKEYAKRNRILLYDRNRLPHLVNQAYPTPIDISQAKVMCGKCGAITPMIVGDVPTTGRCMNGHVVTGNVVKADLRVFSSTGIPNCEICAAPMRVVNGRRGKFWGCSRYPNCRSSKPLESPTPIPTESLRLPF